MQKCFNQSEGIKKHRLIHGDHLLGSAQLFKHRYHEKYERLLAELKLSSGGFLQRSLEAAIVFRVLFFKISSSIGLDSRTTH